MLTCIACSKALEEPICNTELNGSTTPMSQASNETSNNLTAQIKDLSLKLSGAYRQCKPFATSTVYLKGTRRRSGCGSSTSTSTSSSFSSSKAAAGTPMFESLAGRFNNIVFVEEEEPREWIVEFETGVLITLVSFPKGKNHLKRVSFSKEIFDKRHTGLWWIENYDKIVELYNVERMSREAFYLLIKSGGEEEERCAREATQPRDAAPASPEH